MFTVFSVLTIVSIFVHCIRFVSFGDDKCVVYSHLYQTSLFGMLLSQSRISLVFMGLIILVEYSVVTFLLTHYWRSNSMSLMFTKGKLVLWVVLCVCVSCG